MVRTAQPPAPSLRSALARPSAYGTEPLRIRLLGGFLLEQGSRPLPPIPSRAARSLFAYLVVHRDRQHTRNLLAGTLWPDLPESKARRRLSQALWQIQDALGEMTSPEPYLVATGDTLAFSTASAYWLDLEEFEQALDAADRLDSGDPYEELRALDALQSAVELYQGDFLAGFYDEWVFLEQDGLRERYVEGLSELVDALTRQGSLAEALTYARRLTNHDPLREEGHRSVMRLCFLLGRTGDAIQQFERCRSVFADELNAEPSGETTELYDRILRHRQAGLEVAEQTERSSPLFSRDSTVPFVGRTEERAAIVDRMELALRGQGGVVLVEGDPGLGKTRLVEEAVEDARWRGFEVLWAQCSELRMNRPYQAIVDALARGLNSLRVEQLRRHVDPVWLAALSQLDPRLAELLPDLPATEPLRAGEESDRLRHAVVEALAALGRMSPLLVVVDDVQWADAETLAVLVGLSRRLTRSRMLACLTYRTDDVRARTESWDAIRALDRTAGRGRVILAPLTVFELGELVRRGLGLRGVPHRLTTRLLDETGGNALFALETLRALRDHGLLEPNDEEALVAAGRGSSLPITAGVQGVIAGRVAALDETATTVLEIAAVRGAAVDLDVLTSTCDLDRAAIAAAVDRLLGRGLLAHAEHGYRFHHEQIRRVTYDGIDEPTRRDLHLRVAEALEVLHPEEVEELGEHFARGGGGVRAVHFLRRAGERAQGVHAYRAALHHFTRALEVADTGVVGDEELLPLLTHTEACLAVLGQREEQGRVLDRLTVLAARHAAWAADVERRRASFLAHTDRFDEAESAARHAVELAEAGGGDGLGPALTALATVLAWSGRAALAVPHLQRAIGVLAGEPSEEVEARCALARALGEVQRYDEAWAELDQALEVARGAGDRRGEAEALSALGVVHMERGAPIEAEPALRDALAHCRELGYRHGEGVNLVNLGNLLVFTSRVSEALDCYDSGLDTFRSLEERRGEAMVRANIASVRHESLGDDERAARDARRALEFFRDIGDRRGEAQCLDVLGAVAAAQGRARDARTYLDAGLAALLESPDAWLEVQLHYTIARMEVATDPAAAHARMTRALEACRDAGMDDLAPPIQALLGYAALALDRPEEAYAATSAAVDAISAGSDRACAIFFAHYAAASALGLDAEAAATVEEGHAELVRLLDGLEPEQRHQALKVPAHRVIADLWALGQPRRATVRIPALDAPIGRPLRDEEWVEVSWTVEDPEDEKIADLGTRRRARMLRLVAEASDQGAAPTVEDLAAALSASRSTVRRDLAALREQGHDLRTRGTRTA